MQVAAAFLLRPGQILIAGWLVLLSGALAAEELRAPGSVTLHTVVPTECTMYFSWQSLGILYSHSKAGQTGPITRIISCTDEQKQTYKVSPACHMLWYTHYVVLSSRLAWCHSINDQVWCLHDEGRCVPFPLMSSDVCNLVLLHDSNLHHLHLTLVWLQDITLVPSHVVPSLTIDKEHNDVYSAYNKPGAVMYWLRVCPNSYLLPVSRPHKPHQAQPCVTQCTLQQLKTSLHKHPLLCCTVHAGVHQLCLDL